MVTHHADRSSRARLVLGAGFCLALTALGGCPAAVGQAEDAEEVEQVDASDPRVLRSERTGDLYPRDVKAMPAEDPTTQDPAALPTTPGVGVPDETNGECRLYASEYPDPQCCKPEFGVDAERIKELCGFEVYLGEYFRNGCGYHFRKTPTSPTESLWIVTLRDSPDTADARADHDLLIQRRFKQEGFESKPIPGIPGAYWSTFAETGWAALPGWKLVRQVGYQEGFCSGAIQEVLADITAAKEPPNGAERLSLIPKARR